MKNAKQWKKRKPQELDTLKVTRNPLEKGKLIGYLLCNSNLEINSLV